MTIQRTADGAAATSIVAAIASFLEPITGILQFVAVVVAICAGLYAIAAHRRKK